MSNLRILLVDDESVVRMTTSMIVKKLGHEVIAFDNGLDALTFYRDQQSKIDIVIVDSHMPGMSGSELFQELQKVNSDVIAVLASGFLDDSQMENSAHEGFAAVINKPFHIQELKELLESF